MNCKPGDLAVIVREAQHHVQDALLGRLCIIVEAAQPGDYTTPSGDVWLEVDPSSWCVQLQSSVTIERINGGPYRTTYIVAPDAVLRPIRPGNITDSEVRDLFKPAPVKEVA